MYCNVGVRISPGKSGFPEVPPAGTAGSKLGSPGDTRSQGSFWQAKINDSPRGPAGNGLFSQVVQALNRGNKRKENCMYCISLCSIDDVAFSTANPSVEEVTDQLQHLPPSNLAWGSKYGTAFDRTKSQSMLLKHKPPLSHPPQIRLDNALLTPQAQIKWLGVILDPKLCFTGHIDTHIAKGITIANHLAIIARTGWSVPLM